jgi:hypothetical protein
MKQRAWSAGLLGSILLAAAPSAAFAQDPPPPPPMGGDETGAGAGYPADLPARPLVLPEGMLEVDASVRVPTNDNVDFFDYMILSMLARYSLGTVEPFVGLDLALIKPDGADTLQTLLAGARAPVGPGAAKGTFFLFAPGGDDETTAFEIDGSYEYKHHLNDQFAAIGEGGLAYYNLSSSDPLGGGDLSLYAIYLFARATGQIKLTPEASLEAGLLLSLPIADGGSVGGMDVDPDTDTLVGFHGMGLYNLGQFDIYGRLEVRDEADTTTTLVVGALFRPL